MVKPILTCINREVVTAKIEARLVAVETGCWEWQGPIDAWGYGKIRVKTPDGTRHTGAHRAAWLAMVGDIPDESLQIDHLCRNRKCVNTVHMELVTNAVNTIRSYNSGTRAKTGRKLGSGKKSCKKHGEDHVRERIGKDGYTRWVCQVCATARTRAFLDRKKAERERALTLEPLPGQLTLWEAA